MQKKKVLFVGDLRVAGNYGAIATSEALIKLVKENVGNIDIKYIDHRSFNNETPDNGWPVVEEMACVYRRKKNKQKILSIIIPLLKAFKPLVSLIFGRQVVFKNKYFIPYKYSLYEEYYTKVKQKSVLKYEQRLIEWADIVYINGEGNIVNGTDREGKYRNGGLYVLFIAWLAKVKYNKTTCLLNHTVDPANNDIYDIIDDLYPKLDYVFVREKLSLRNLEERGINNADFVPDALFSYNPVDNWEPSKGLLKQIDFSKPYICIGDSSGIKNAYNKVKWDVPIVLGELVDELKNIIPQIIFIDGYNGMDRDVNKVISKNKLGYINLSNCSYHDLYHVLEKSEVFISGRWHASILSVLANTPIISWGSDSHKTKSLYDLLDYPYKFYEVNTLPIHIKDMTHNVKLILENKNSIKKLLSNKINDIKPLVIKNVQFLNLVIDSSL